MKCKEFLYALANPESQAAGEYARYAFKMELICIKDIDDFFGFKDEWNNLVSISKNNSLFLRHEWLSIWWMSYGEQKELIILLVKHNNRLIAAAPLMIVKDSKRGIPLRRIAFMGDSEWTLNDFIIFEQERDAIEMIIDFLLSKEWDMIDLRNMPTDSNHIGIISDILGARCFSFLYSGASHFPVLPVSGGWEVFYNSRSLKFKKVMRNKINRINKAGRVTVERYYRETEVLQILPVILELSLKGWKHWQIKNAISSTKENNAFYTRLSESMSKIGWLDIWLLRLNEVPIAFEYHVRYGNKIHALVADFDEDYKHISPGSILDFYIMQYIFNESGAKEYDMGSGESFYKANWTDNVRKSVSLSVYRNTLRGRMLQLTETRIIPMLKPLRDRFKNIKRHYDINKISVGY